MKSETKGVALPGVNVGDFRRMPVPIPPLAEQRRIVEKVDHLLSMINTLFDGLRLSSDLQCSFAAASVHHLED
jgi:type I restriction enzyme S subunit